MNPTRIVVFVVVELNFIDRCHSELGTYKILLIDIIHFL